MISTARLKQLEFNTYPFNVELHKFSSFSSFVQSFILRDLKLHTSRFQPKRLTKIPNTFTYWNALNCFSDALMQRMPVRHCTALPPKQVSEPPTWRKYRLHPIDVGHFVVLKIKTPCYFQWFLSSVFLYYGKK